MRLHRAEPHQAPDPTAVGVGMCRLAEQDQPDGLRLFEDPVVADLLGPRAGPMQLAGMRALVVQQIEAAAPGTYGAVVCRTRYLDDAVSEALARRVRQVVVLGAGLDTRAYRLPGIDRARVFEVDLPATQEGKRRALVSRLGALPEHVKFLSVDLETPGFADALADAGLAVDEPAVVVAEGLTQYLTAGAVHHILGTVGAWCVGTELAMTYARADVVRAASGGARAMDLARGGPAWVFGIDPAEVPGLVGAHGFAPVEDVGADEYHARYLRPLGRSLRISADERAFRARVPG